MVLEVLTQQKGSSQQLVGYLSKELDLVARGSAACLRTVAVTALLVPEAQKLTRPHSVHPTSYTGITKH